LESVSVFGIGISEILVEIENFWYTPPLFGAPVEGDPVGISKNYTVSNKKRATLFFDYNSGFSWSIFIPFAPVERGRITLHRSLKNTTSH